MQRILGGLICLVTIVAVGTEVQGRPPASCVIIQDEAGDVQGPSRVPVDPDAALDLRQASLQSDGRVLHAVVTVAGSSTQDSRVWKVSFGNGEKTYTLAAFEHVDGNAFAAYGPGTPTNQPPAGTATGAIDLAHGRISVDVPLAQLQIGPQASFYQFSATASRSIGSNSVSGPQSTSSDLLGGDRAEGSRHYRLDRGCAN